MLGKKTQNGTNNYSEIFVYLLRLRQACCHMSLLAECLDTDELQKQKIESEGLEDMMDNLTLQKDIKPDVNESDGKINDKLETVEALKNDENLTDCLAKSFRSSKLQKLIKMVQGALHEFPEDKLIIVSQWTGVLSIVGEFFVRNEVVKNWDKFISDTINFNLNNLNFEEFWRIIIIKDINKWQ